VPGQPSDDALDIVTVDFDAQRGGLQITMTLAGAHRDDGRYWAYLTDTKTGCRLQVLLGGPDPDGFWDSCSSGWHAVPTRIDPSASVLQALLPWSALPRDVDPRHAFGSLYGETTYTNAGGGTLVSDDATTSQTMGPVR
jgi:hypothetical protein